MPNCKTIGIWLETNYDLDYPVAMQTRSLRLIPHQPELLRAIMLSHEAYEQQSGYRLAEGVREFFVSGDVSPDYVARIQTATQIDPWNHGYAVLLKDEDIVIGSCGYKGPPTEKVVEIGYGIAPAYCGRGYATEAAEVLTAHAFEKGVKIVCAHTLPVHNASSRILTKCGFQWIGLVNDPQDGPIWRWEKSRN
jgi:RimJ/RimL family protein N-acetyltransferase